MIPHTTPRSTDEADAATRELQRPASSIRWFVALWLACLTLDVIRIVFLASPTRETYSVPGMPLLFFTANRLLNSLTMAATIQLIWRSLRLGSLVLQPGEWLLLAAGIWHWLVGIASVLPLLPAFPATDWWLQVAVSSIYAFVLAWGGVRLWQTAPIWSLAMTGLAIAAAMREVVKLLMWRALEHGSLTDVLGSSLISNGYTAINVVNALTAIPLSVAFISDVHRERRRGWLHAIALAWLCGAIVVYSLQEMHFIWLRSR